MYQPPHKQTDKSGENDKFPPVAMYGDTPSARFQKVWGLCDKLYEKGAANYISRDNRALFVYRKKHQESNDQVVPLGTNAVGVDGLRPSYNLSKFCKLKRFGSNGEVKAQCYHSYLTLIKQLPLKHLGNYWSAVGVSPACSYRFNQALTNGCHLDGISRVTVVGTLSSPRFKFSSRSWVRPASMYLWRPLTKARVTRQSCQCHAQNERYNQYMNRRSELQIILPHSSPLVSTLGADHSDRPSSKATVSPARSQGRDLERLRPTKLRSACLPARPTCTGHVSLFARSSASSRAAQHTCQPKRSRKRANALGRQADGKCVSDYAFSSRLITPRMRLREMDSGTDLVQEDHSQTFFQSSLGKMITAWTKTKYHRAQTGQLR